MSTWNFSAEHYTFSFTLLGGNLISSQCNFHRDLKDSPLTLLHTQCRSHLPTPHFSLSLSLFPFLAFTPCTISNFKWKRNDLKGFYVDFSRLCQVEMTSHSPLSFTLQLRKWPRKLINYLINVFNVYQRESHLLRLPWSHSTHRGR